MGRDFLSSRYYGAPAPAPIPQPTYQKWSPWNAFNPDDPDCFGDQEPVYEAFIDPLLVSATTDAQPDPRSAPDSGASSPARGDSPDSFAALERRVFGDDASAPHQLDAARSDHVALAVQAASATATGTPALADDVTPSTPALRVTSRVPAMASLFDVPVTRRFSRSHAAEEAARGAALAHLQLHAAPIMVSVAPART